MPLHANSRKVIIMNAVEITIIVVAAVLLLCGILFGVVSYLVFYEVIARNSKIPGKMDANAKRNDGDQPRKVPSRPARGVAK